MVRAGTIQQRSASGVQLGFKDACLAFDSWRKSFWTQGVDPDESGEFDIIHVSPVEMLTSFMAIHPQFQFVESQLRNKYERMFFPVERKRIRAYRNMTQHNIFVRSFLRLQWIKPDLETHHRWVSIESACCLISALHFIFLHVAIIAILILNGMADLT